MFTAMLIVSGTMKIDPANTAAFLAAAAECSRETRREAGCQAYHFSADELEPGLIHVYEQWDDENALYAHLRLPHVTAFRTALVDLGPRATDVMMYEATPRGRPSPPPLDA